MFHKIPFFIRSKPTYSGVYTSLEECARACRTEYIYQSPKHDHEIAREFWLKLTHQNIGAVGRNMFSPLVLSVLNHRKVRFIDFGGADNPAISYFPKSLREKLEYLCVDRPELVQLINEVTPKINQCATESISVITDEALERSKIFTVVYLGASLQYLHQTSDIEKIFRLAADLVIVAESTFSNTKESLWVKQINFPPREFPNHCWSSETLLRISGNYGYTMSDPIAGFNGYKHATLGPQKYSTVVFTRTRTPA